MNGKTGWDQECRRRHFDIESHDKVGIRGWRAEVVEKWSERFDRSRKNISNCGGENDDGGAGSRP